MYVLILPFICSISLYSHAKLEMEDKIYCNASIEDNFADDTALVILSKEASLVDKEYSAADFIDYGCINVVDITTEVQCMQLVCFAMSMQL